jgi:hypothetical protein
METASFNHLRQFCTDTCLFADKPGKCPVAGGPVVTFVSAITRAERLLALMLCVSNTYNRHDLVSASQFFQLLWRNVIRSPGPPTMITVSQHLPRFVNNLFERAKNCS